MRTLPQWPQLDSSVIYSTFHLSDFYKLEAIYLYALTQIVFELFAFWGLEKVNYETIRPTPLLGNRKNSSLTDFSILFLKFGMLKMSFAVIFISLFFQKFFHSHLVSLFLWIELSKVFLKIPGNFSIFVAFHSFQV